MNVQELYDEAHKYCDDNPHHWVQFHFNGDLKEKKAFIQYLHYHAHHWRTDALEGFQRKSNGMHLKDFLVYVHDNAFMGIKFVKYPISTFQVHDRWEGGYIEGYVRTMTAPDYFFWSYMKPDKLKMILSDYTENLKKL